MPWYELAWTIWRTLQANRLRATLTLLGVTTGVGTLVLLASVVGGGLAAIGRTVQEASGSDVIRARVEPWTERGEPAAPLTTADMRAVAEARGLEEATVLPQRLTRGEVRIARVPVRVWCVGTIPTAPQVYQLEVEAGRFLTEQDLAARARVVVVGPDLAEALARERAGAGVVGAELRLWGERLQVVGVLRRKPTLRVDNLSWNQAVALPETTYALLRGGSEVETILIKANTLERLATTLPLLVHTVEAVLQWRAHGPDTLRVRDASPGSSGERTFLAALQYLLVGVASICLVSGGINLMNIMLVTVAERTREIGLRLALGARRRDIRRQFLGEAVVLAAAGGLAGISLGLLASWGVSRLLTRALGHWPWVVEPGVLGLAFGSALLVGVAFGWYPAERAATLPPVECLRQE
ncbi:MAG: ABC transporter permease [Candidatus Sericytochromatia bacterium]|nr:ABC transporter permease [Candidatus Sericytochromatia bacterium]